MSTPSIATRLEAARIAARLSQPAMASKIGISTSLLRLLESGRLEPTPRVAALLTTAFGEDAVRLLSPVRIVGTLPTLREAEAAVSA